MKKRILALWLALALLLGSGAGTTVFATGDGSGPQGESCAHTHDKTCGYLEGAGCSHVCEVDCGGLTTGQSGGPATPADIPTPIIAPQAAGAVVDIGGMETVAAVRSAIQAAINTAPFGGVVTVTNSGDVFDAAATILTLNISWGRTVKWNADYSGSLNYDVYRPDDSLIKITGEGTFELTGGEIENTGSVITSEGNITVSPRASRPRRRSAG